MSAGRSGLGLRTLAVALLAGMAGNGANSAKELAAQQMAGERMMASLRWHHRGIVSHKPSGAAAAKRASVKRRNVLKRQSARR